ncbi:hypothetical protein [Micromonospora carbonacea]|uniref:hypothetical protein n=1 Tax=Micromonospora carbonacea TaxID=47853 RepID=UPI00371F2AE3
MNTTHSPRVGDTIDVNTGNGWTLGVVSWTGAGALKVGLDNGTTWEGHPNQTRPAPTPAHKYGDIVTAAGHDGTWRVVHVGPSTPAQRAAGEGPHMYALVNTVTGKPAKASTVQAA